MKCWEEREDKKEFISVDRAGRDEVGLIFHQVLHRCKDICRTGRE